MCLLLCIQAVKMQNCWFYTETDQNFVVAKGWSNRMDKKTEFIPSLALGALQWWSLLLKHDLVSPCPKERKTRVHQVYSGVDFVFVSTSPQGWQVSNATFFLSMRPAHHTVRLWLTLISTSELRRRQDSPFPRRSQSVTTCVRCTAIHSPLFINFEDDLHLVQISLHVYCDKRFPLFLSSVAVWHIRHRAAGYAVLIYAVNLHCCPIKICHN